MTERDVRPVEIKKVEVKRKVINSQTVAFAIVSGLILVGVGGVAYAYGQDPKLPCSGDFDVSKGVAVNKNNDYLALGTAGQTVEVGDDFMTEFNNGQLRLLRHVYGGKKLGDVIGWAFTDEDGKVSNGSIQFLENGEIVCKDE